MTDAQTDPDDASEQARRVLRAVLAEAAVRALGDGIPPEALIGYAEERIAELRRSADGRGAGTDGSSPPDERARSSEDVLDHLDDMS